MTAITSLPSFSAPSIGTVSDFVSTLGAYADGNARNAAVPPMSSTASPTFSPVAARNITPFSVISTSASVASEYEADTDGAV